MNDPDIILADEPTGALDTETSIQVMEILKEVSKDRLVLMVTHNPDLAEKYSSRIIRMLDGEIIGDTAPLNDSEVKAEAEHDEAQREANKNKKSKRSTMSFWTAFKLSLKNLFTKKGRTFLTSFAGSIGIIGIALILAVSQGTTNYIDTVQGQTLSNYPLTIESTAMDLGSLVSSMMSMGQNIEYDDENTVHSRPLIYNVANVIKSSNATSNDLRSFKKYLESEIQTEDSALHDAIMGLQYGYDVKMRIFTKTVDGRIEEADVGKLMRKVVPNLLGSDMQSAMGSYMQSMATFSMNIWQEMLPGRNGSYVNDLLFDQYEIYGNWPSSDDEIVLVMNKNKELSDMALVTLGILGDDYIDRVYKDVDSGKELPDERESYSFDEIMKTDCRLILNGDLYAESKDGTWHDITSNDHKDDIQLKNRFENNSIKLKISGIIWPKEDATAAMMTGSIGYTSALTQRIIRESEKTDVVKAQKADPEIDIFTGKAFSFNSGVDLTDESKAEAFKAYYEALSFANRADAYWTIRAIDDADKTVQMLKMSAGDRSAAEVVADMMQMAGFPMDREMILSYLAGMSDEEVWDWTRSQLVNQSLQTLQTEREETEKLPQEERENLYNGILSDKSDEQMAMYYDNVQFSSSTYESNMAELANVDLEAPIAINIYASSFEAKDVIASEIEKYNDSVEEEQKIEYTDFVALMMTAVTTIIDAITYVLIAFVAISLIVSSIMVGVITLISVQERTKEIGILRAIGASKRDVSHMFNAETIIIGFAAGLIGVLFTYILCLPINLLLHVLTGIGTLNAILPPVAALILVLISMFLTVFSGFIPSRSAAKKDPAVALRTE